MSKLTAILALIQESDLMCLSLLAGQKTTVLADIEKLSQLKRQARAPLSHNDTLSPWQLLGEDQKWQYWINVRIAEKNSELAILSADYEEQKIKAQRVVGHHNTFNRLANKS